MASDDTTRFRLGVVGEALRLFAEQGYEATTVDHIAHAAGISRRTFFRQFHAKEDVVFADHELLLEQVEYHLAHTDLDPWEAVCEAALIVFEGLTQWREVSRRRYAVVHRVPALREREIVTVFRYERLFSSFLRTRLPDESALTIAQFAAAVTATHNLLLRRTVRDELGVDAADLRASLAALRSRFAAAATSGEDVVVAVFPKGTAPRRVADVLERQLNGNPPKTS